MAIFEIEGPDGSVYEIDAPDEQSAVTGFQQMMGGQGHGAQTQDAAVAPQSDAAREFSDFASMATQSPAYAEYDQLPAWQKPLVAASDIVTMAADVPTFGFKEEIAAAMRAPFTDKSFSEELAEQERLSNAAAARSGWAGTAAQATGGLKVGADMARRGLSLGANAATRGGGLGKVALGSAVDGGIMAGLYGAGQEGDMQDRAWNAATGAGTGFVLGGALPVATSAISSGFRRAISPFVSSPERTAAANLLSQEGVPLTAGQRVGNKTLQFAESELGGGPAAQIAEDQGRAFTRAAMRRAGQDTLADPDSMAALNQRLGQGFKDISARNTLRADQQMVRDMNHAAQEYARVLPTEQRAIFGDLGDDIIERLRANGGTMSGEAYQTVRSRLSRMANSNRQRDPDFADAIRGLRNALDDAMDRGINPNDAGAWRELRRQWGNKKVLENASAGAAGEDAGIGIISPARLRTAASSGNRGAFARGESDFTDLARAGQAVMTPLPNSGTASRNWVRNLGAGTLAGGGALAAGPLGLAAGLAAPFAGGRALMSGPVQRYLGNQAATGSGDPMLRAAIARMIMTGNVPAIADAGN